MHALFILLVVLAVVLYVLICRSFWLSRILAIIGLLFGTLGLFLTPACILGTLFAVVFASSYYCVEELGDGKTYQWGLIKKENAYDVTVKGKNVTVSPHYDFNGCLGYIWAWIAPYVVPIFAAGILVLFMLIFGLIFDAFGIIEIGIIVCFVLLDIAVAVCIIYSIVDDGYCQDDNPIDAFFDRLFYKKKRKK